MSLYDEITISEIRFSLDRLGYTAISPVSDTWWCLTSRPQMAYTTIANIYISRGPRLSHHESY
jgi:hypothetical protein